jgi:hypothetical protein
MTAPHDRPTASELVHAVREWMEEDLIKAVEPRLVFHLRVAMNMLDMVDRELQLGVPMELRHAEVLRELGVSDDAELAMKIRSGECDEDFSSLLSLLRPIVEDKVRVANPKYLR